MNAIEIENIYKTYPGKRGSQVNALKDLSFTVGEGEVFGFLGPNGAGKSTAIKILMGLIRPSSGKAAIMGHDAQTHLARKHVGFLPENPAFYDYLTAEEYLVFIAKTFGMNGGKARDKTGEALKLLELWDARNRPLRGYSKGMVQRLGLAQALIHNPDVYILDEPMSGLDPAGRVMVKDLISDLKARGKCVFFSTHITADVETVCDRVAVIVDGVLQCVEQVGAILTSGIIGYRFQIRTPGSTERREREVSRDKLAESIAELQSAGQEITLIEPIRKNLETFFLDIVKGNKC